jgi:PTH2 family peptidyl-tRNA hydrolase
MCTRGWRARAPDCAAARARRAAAATNADADASPPIIRAAASSVQGAVVGFLLALFLNSPTGGGGGGGGGAADADAGLDGSEDPSAERPAAAPKKGRTVGGAKKSRVAANWAGTAPPAGTEVKLVMVVREDLGMSVGKTAAQCAHAAVGIVQKLSGKRNGLLSAWEESGQTKICLKCTGIDEMIALAKAAEAASLPVYVVQDAGRTEVAAGTSTVLAIGPGAVEAINAVTGQLKLLR